MEKPQNITPGQVWRRAAGDEVIIQHEGSPSNREAQDYVTYNIPSKNVSDLYESVSHIKDTWEFVAEQSLPVSLHSGQKFLYENKEIVLLRETLSSESDNSYWKWVYVDKPSETHVEAQEVILAKAASYTYLGSDSTRPDHIRIGQSYRYGSVTKTIVSKGALTDTKAIASWSFDDNTWATVDQILGEKYVFVEEKSLDKPATIRPGQVWTYSGVDFVVKARTIANGKEAWTFEDEAGYEFSEKMLNDASWQLVEERSIKIKPGQKWLLDGKTIVIQRRGTVTDVSRQDAWSYSYEGGTGLVWTEEATFLTNSRFQLIEDIAQSQPTELVPGQTWQAQDKTFHVISVGATPDTVVLFDVKNNEEVKTNIVNVLKSGDYEFVSASLPKPNKRQHNQHWTYRGRELVLTKRVGNNWRYKFLDGHEGESSDEELKTLSEFQFVSEAVKPAEVIPGQRWIYNGREVIVFKSGSTSDSSRVDAHTFVYVDSYATLWSYDANTQSNFEFVSDPEAKPAVAVRQLWTVENKICSITKIEGEIVYFKFVGSASKFSQHVSAFAEKNHHYLGKDWALPKPNKLKAGQVWQGGSSKFTVLYAGSANGTPREGFWTLDEGSLVAGNDIIANGNWFLISDSPTSAWTGQVWKDKSDKEYVVVQNLGGDKKTWQLSDGSDRVPVEEASLLDPNNWTFVRNQLPKPRVAIGQIWKHKGREFVVRGVGTTTDKNEKNAWVLASRGVSYSDAWDYNNNFQEAQYEFIGNTEKPKALDAEQVFALDGKSVVLKSKTTSADGHIIWKFDDGSWDFEQNILTSNRYVFITAKNRGTEERPSVSETLSEVQLSSNKQTVISNTLDLLGTGDSVFGDYVRDMLAGDSIGDVDIFLVSDITNYTWTTANERARSSFISKLQSKFGIANVKISPSKEVGKCFKQEAHIIYNGSTIVLRLVTEKTNNQFANEEVDTNSLAMGRDRVVKAKKGLDVERVKTHIGARSFVALTGALAGAVLDKLVAKGYTDSSRLRIGTIVRVLNAKELLKHLSTEEQQGTFEIIGESGNDYLLRMPDGLTPDGEKKGHTVHELGGVPGWWVPKSEVKAMERKILEVKVKETEVGHLPKEIRDPGKQRTFKYLREDATRYLLEMPAGVGHKADTKEFGDKDSWWVPKDACEITKQEGGEEKKMETKKEEKKVESAGGSFMEQFKSEAAEAAYIAAGTQMARGVRLAILSIVEKQLRERYNNDGIKGKKQNSAVQSALEGTKAMLDSDFGQSMIQMAIGYGLQYAPMIKDDPRAKKLAGHMRVQGMATGMNAVFGVATEHLFPVLAGALSGLPALPEIKLEDIKVTEPAVETLAAGGSTVATAAA